MFTLPPMIVIGIVVYFDTGSPLFFQSRVGKNQKQFTLIKFRTMALNTPSV
jgi:O-antigen biosynthesis protein WbqP